MKWLTAACCAVFSQRPELSRLALQSQQTEAELALQENQQNAALDFHVLGPKDIGYGKNKLNHDELYPELNVDIPLQQVGRTLKRRWRRPICNA